MAAEASVKATRAALLSEVRNIQGAFERDLSVIQRQEAGLSGLFERAKTQALELNLLDIEYTRLRRSKENTEKLYSLVLERTKESDLTKMLRVNNIRIVDRPTVARAPIRPNVPLNIAGGIMIGLVLGIGAAMGRALLDRTIKTPDDVEQLIGVSSHFLGLIPEIDRVPGAAIKGPRRKRHLATAGAPELAVHDNPTSGIAEASRSIRTNLLFMAPDHPYRTLLVTSAGPSEGKTTVACCIAIAMAQAGKRVALIDCDLRRPRIHRIFHTGSDIGVTTALLHEHMETCAIPTHIENLSVNVAGPIPPNPAEILQSERFKSYLKLISSQFDQVILDSSPLVAVTDAAILSTLVDGTVVVVRAFQTRKELAQHALRSLSDVGAKIAGVVLNAVNLNRDEYKYAYHYYRRDKYYGQTPGRPAEQEEASPPAA
jgi:capsular exopolysaccharide synthesis family protein